MKIIKRGKLPDPEVHRCTCKECNTIFECDETELIAGGISCPVCYNHIQVTNPYKINKRDPYIDPPWRKTPRDVIWLEVEKETNKKRPTVVCRRGPGPSEETRKRYVAVPLGIKRIQ